MVMVPMIAERSPFVIGAVLGVRVIGWLRMVHIAVRAGRIVAAAGSAGMIMDMPSLRRRIHSQIRHAPYGQVIMGVIVSFRRAVIRSRVVPMLMLVFDVTVAVSVAVDQRLSHARHGTSPSPRSG